MSQPADKPPVVSQPKRVMLLAAILSLSFFQMALAEPPPSDSLATNDMTSDLARAREFIKLGNYDQAIETLQLVISESKAALEHLDEAYLLLAKTYVIGASHYRNQLGGRQAADLFMNEARKTILDCLSIAPLRHTRPEPPTDYPKEMLTLFEAVRNEIFGSLRISRVVPGSATVRFDGEVLKPDMAGIYEVHDVPVGHHRIYVHGKGYKEHAEDVTIAPSSTLDRNYRLQKNRGVIWYASRSMIVAAGAFGLSRLGGSDEGSPEPLPAPPDPPN